MPLFPQYAGSGGGLYPASSQSQAILPAGYQKIDEVPGQGLSKAQIAAAQALVSGDGVPGQVLALKQFTGRAQLTGGTPATKTVLLEVPIPDGWLSRLDVRMDIETSLNWTNSANNKDFGISLGLGSAAGGTVGGSVDLRALTVTTTGSYTDKIVVGRSGETPTRLYLALPNNSRIFGTNPGGGATAGVLANAAINPDAVGQSLWVWGKLAVTTEQVSLEHLSVLLQRGCA